MPGSQPGVLGLFTTPAKCLIIIIFLLCLCQSVFTKQKAPLRLGSNLCETFVGLEFDNFSVKNDCDKVDNPPNPAKENGDKNPNNHHCPVLFIDFLDDTIDHPG